MYSGGTKYGILLKIGFLFPVTFVPKHVYFRKSIVQLRESDKTQCDVKYYLECCFEYFV